MLGPIGSEVMAIFRLLSPDEIDNYIVEEKVTRIEGTKTASGEELPYDSSKQFYSKSSPKQEEEEEEDFDVAKTAKIIPLHAYQEEESETPQERENPDHEPQAPQPTSNGSGGVLDSIGILSASQIREQEAARLKAERAKEDSITVFLLKEREKMRKSKQRITEQRAMKMYQTNAAVDLDVDTDFDPETEEANSSGDMRGILVNKRQY